jgi:hypothetical protein
MREKDILLRSYCQQGQTGPILGANSQLSGKAKLKGRDQMSYKNLSISFIATLLSPMPGMAADGGLTIDNRCDSWLAFKQTNASCSPKGP